MASVSSSPVKRTASFASSTPTTSRLAGSQATQASPHYSTTRRHSLYGTEDRVVIDPGSLIWKVGFSGEGRPRSVFHAAGSSVKPLWSLRRASSTVDRMEEDRMLEIMLESCLRSVFHQHLLTDPKSRKVIIVEHPLMPLYVKDMIAHTLFDNLQVPSVSFVSGHLLSLLAVGRITGLVVDCGHLETTTLPIFAARPLFTQLKSTPLAGSRLSSHLRAWLLLFGTYLPPPTSLSGAANIPAANRSTRVPQEILTDEVIEEIKTRCCFVGGVLDTTGDAQPPTPQGEDSEMLDLPHPGDSAPSESDYSHLESNISSQQGSSSDFSIISRPGVVVGGDARGMMDENNVHALSAMYKRQSTATDIQMCVTPPSNQQTGTGKGTLVIPGWIRERATEMLFEGGDVDECSVAEVILEALLKVPVDLRKTLASSILVTGGTPMLPGFIPRLHAEILRAIFPPSTRRPVRPRPDRPPLPLYDRYAVLRPLVPYFAILNNPSPGISTSQRATANAGKAPAFTPATLAWVGGSLAGSLKTGGLEVTREKWDEKDANPDGESDVMDTAAQDPSTVLRPPKSVLPDWTRQWMVASPAFNPGRSPQAHHVHA